MRKFIATFVLIAALFAKANVYHEVTSKVNYFDYTPFSYTYTNADGVVRTAMLTDVATSAEQIAALLKEVYVNPSIPGIHYGWDYNGTQSRRLDYDSNGHKISNQNEGYEWQRKSAGEFFPNPTLDGMTLIMISINDAWKKSMASNTTALEYIRRCYTSARLMTSFTRVNDPVNPGYIYQINDVSTNRFFFISKGKPRGSYTRPLYRLYEQISPVKGDNGHITDDFIDEMRSGHSYLCYHDCTDVGTIGTDKAPHWFTISNSGENFNLSNITIFIPDRRFEPQNDPQGRRPDAEHLAEVGGVPYFKDYGNSNDNNEENWMKELMPKVLVYKVDLSATATPSDVDGYYDINLSWDTNFTRENMNVDIPQHFYVYVIDGNNRVRLESIVEQPTTELTHTYRVEQTVDPQTFSYIVTAAPINYDDNGQIRVDIDGNPVITVRAESPVRTVTVPGQSSAYFIQAQEYRSRFEVNGANRQYNIYKNKMSVRPSSNEDYLSIKNNNEAYHVIRTDADGNRAEVATVRFDKVGGTDEYDYNVDYNAQTQVTNPVFDDEVPVTSGRLSGFENSTIVVIDRFTASTKDNDHSDHYTYSFELLDDGVYESHSNLFTVPVYKTRSVVSGIEHTLEEVNADTCHLAKAIPNNIITFDAINDPSANLVEYGIFRSDYLFGRLVKIGKAENANNAGTYSLYTMSENGMINEFIGVVSINDEQNGITIPDYNNKDYNQQILYVPVITTLYDGDVEKKNTYGCDFKTMYYPQIDIDVVYQEKTNPFSGPNGLEMGYRVELDLIPKIPSKSGMTAYYYRLWRVVTENGSEVEYLLNNEDGVAGEPWGARYYTLWDVYPKYEPSVNDIFISTPFFAEPKIVTYIARLYATTVPEESGTANAAPSRYPSSGRDYNHHFNR